MKIHLVCLLLLCNHCMYGQGELPKNVNANKSLLTIGHYLPGTCGFVNSNSSYRNGHNDNNLMQVLDSLGAYDLGSGFVYRIKNVSYVITCEHVILGSDSIVAYDSAYKPYPLELVGGDSFYDVSVLKFKNAKDNERWEGIAFDYTPQKNTEVYATGFWKWEGGLSLEVGDLLKESTILSDRELPVVKLGFVENDAPIQSGYSGGALFNLEGQVIGMNTMIHVSNETSFALSSSIIKKIVHNIVENKTEEMTRSFLGIQFAQNADNSAVMIEQVLDGTPAVRFRKKLAGKRLHRIAGVRVNEIYDVLKTMENCPPGNAITLELEDTQGVVSSVNIVPNILIDKFHEAIAKNAIQVNTEQDIQGVKEIDGSVFIYTNNEEVEMAMTAGLKNERVYCINSLSDLGNIVRIFSLHGELRIGLDKAFNKGRWIRFSNTDNKLILYY